MAALFAEASAVSDDERLRNAAGGLTASLRTSWGRESRVAIAAASVDGCLRASDRNIAVEIMQEAIDELERIVAAAYRPGEGVSQTAAAGLPRGRLADQTSAASALLTAFECTSRLPYSMLAEELMQFARRTLWDADAGGFFDGDSGANRRAQLRRRVGAQPAGLCCSSGVISGGHRASAPDGRERAGFCTGWAGGAGARPWRRRLRSRGHRLAIGTLKSATRHLQSAVACPWTVRPSSLL
jgi:hypothetical protein